MTHWVRIPTASKNLVGMYLLIHHYHRQSHTADRTYIKRMLSSIFQQGFRKKNSHTVNYNRLEIVNLFFKLARISCEKNQKRKIELCSCWSEKMWKQDNALCLIVQVIAPFSFEVAKYKLFKINFCEDFEILLGKTSMFKVDIKKKARCWKFKI